MASDEERLHRLHDGELTDEQRAAIEPGLDERGRAKLQAIGEIGAALRSAIEGEAAAVPGGFLDGVWAKVEAGIGAPAKAKAERPGLLTRMGRALAEYKMVWASSAVAAAAVFAIYLGGGMHPAQSNGCEIESLEVSGATATVMKLPTTDHGDDTTTVIWLDEEEAE
jgi:hypothetical protein